MIILGFQRCPTGFFAQLSLATASEATKTIVVLDKVKMLKHPRKENKKRTISKISDSFYVTI